jgi:TonB family protein
MKIRSSALAVPAALILTVAAAGAQSIELTPLAPTQPTAIAVHGATCAAPNVPAKMNDAYDAYLDYPEISRAQHAEGVAYIGITLRPNGTVAQAWPIASTGNRLLDTVAMETAHNARYTPERSQCEALGGDYKIRVDFSSGE